MKQYCRFRTYPGEDWKDEVIGYPSTVERTATKAPPQTTERERPLTSAMSEERRQRAMLIIAEARRQGANGQLFTPNAIAAAVHCRTHQVGLELAHAGVARFVKRTARNAQKRELRYWQLCESEDQQS